MFDGMTMIEIFVWEKCLGTNPEPPIGYDLVTSCAEVRNRIEAYSMQDFQQSRLDTKHCDLIHLLRIQYPEPCFLGHQVTEIQSQKSENRSLAESNFDNFPMFS